MRGTTPGPRKSLKRLVRNFCFFCLSSVVSPLRTAQKNARIYSKTYTNREVVRMNAYVPRPRELAQEHIMAYIAENGLGPGDRLPPEREMCQMWGFNRSTLRSAIAMMTDAGDLYAVQGSGTCVAPRFRRTLQDLQSLTEYAASGGWRLETRLLSCLKMECGKQLSRRLHLVLGQQVHRISRLRILDDVPILIETAYIPVNLAPDLERHNLVTASLFRTLREGYGLCLDHGDEKTSITSATEEEAQYLNIQPGDPVFWIVSLTNAPDGTPVEYCRTVGRADRMELVSVLRWRGGEEMDHG